MDTGMLLELIPRYLMVGVLAAFVSLTNLS